MLPAEGHSFEESQHNDKAAPGPAGVPQPAKDNRTQEREAVSGIACILHCDGRPADMAMIRAMTAAMSHRGPDGIADTVSGQAAFGHCMLHTTAESLGESQPLANEDGTCLLVMDGYIANYEELREELLGRGAHLRETSDAELVLRAYEAWGKDAPRRFDGEFALAIWDAGQRELLCARDHQGLRPLFYHFDGKRLLAASDVKAILALLPEQPALNHGFMTEFLTGHFYTQDETVWTGIRRLEAAHTMRVGAQGPIFERYWALPQDVSISYRRDEDYVAHYRAMLEQCVARASRSHRPVGVHVSGGLDSTAIFCLGEKLRRDGRLQAPGLRGYALAGPPGDRSDEVEYARAAALIWDMPLEEHELFMPDLDWFDKSIAEDCDLPAVPNTVMMLRIERELVAQGSRVCLNGLGGDQWLSGTGYYYRQQIERLQPLQLLTSLRADLDDFGLRHTARSLLHYGVLPALPDKVRAGLSRLRHGKAGRNRDIYSSPPEWLTTVARKELNQRREAYLEKQPEQGLGRAKQFRISDPYIASMWDFNNRQYARSGFDMRHPMHSRAFIEFSASTPEHIRRRGRTNKWVHRQAMTGILPDEVRNRVTKAEFSLPYFHQDTAIGKVISDGLEATFCELADPAGAAKYYNSYCNAAIDSKTTHEVWGIYVVNRIATLATA